MAVPPTWIRVRRNIAYLSGQSARNSDGSPAGPVIVPDANLTTEVEEIETVAILTTHADSIGGPDAVDGLLQTYEVIPLSGTVTPAGP